MTMRAFVMAAVLGSSGAFAATAAPPPPPCEGAAFRAFDFWLGTWQVHKPDGKLAGHNTITREYGGCVLHEHYTTEHGYSGESLNIYDATRKVWHQSWVDNTGLLPTLEGGIRDGAMVLRKRWAPTEQQPSSASPGRRTRTAACANCGKRRMQRASGSSRSTASTRKP